MKPNHNNLNNFQNYHSQDFIAEEDIEEIIPIDDINEPISSGNELEMEELIETHNEESPYIQIDEDYEINCQDETFQTHNGSVFCAAIPKVNSIKFSKCILTGGEDDYAYLWNIESFVQINSIQHRDSVISVGFNSIGDYALTADMSGLINVFKYPDWSTCYFQFETSDIEWSIFHPLLPRVILAGLKNWQIQIWELPSAQYRLLLPPSNLLDNSVEISSAPCVEFFHKNPTYLLAGYPDGSIFVWDIKTASVIHKHHQRHAFSSPVTCLVMFENDQIFAAASDSSPAIKIYNTQRGDVLYRYLYEFNYYKLCQNSSVESILVDQSGQFILSATIVNHMIDGDNINGNQNLIDGQLCVWDIQKKSLFGSINFKEGITKMCLFTLNPHWLLIGLLSGSIGLVDFFKGEILSTLNPHTGPILSLTFKSDENIILSTSDDGGTMCLRVGHSSNLEFNSVIETL